MLARPRDASRPSSLERRCAGRRCGVRSGAGLRPTPTALALLPLRAGVTMSMRVQRKFFPYVHVER